MSARGRLNLGLTLSIAAAAMLAGCAATPLGPTVQVMPGPGKTFDVFQADNATCKGFAAGEVKGQADASNQRALGAALLTAALGAGTGAALGSLGGDAGGGAAAGAALGAGTGTAIGATNNANDQVGIQAQYDNAFSQCMYSKGERVPGFAPAPAVVYAPSPAAAPDPLVRATQAELIRLGYLQGNADGFSGPKTRNAISAYEQSRGLPVDGSPSPRLLGQLQGTPTSSVTASSAPPATSAAWVAPTGSSGSTSAASPSSSGWVAPTKSP
jgi:hypothetical protein